MSNPTHKVVSGDTLYSLAKKYKTTVDELKKLNGLTSDTIKLGAVLKLPVFQESLKFPFIIAKSKNTSEVTIVEPINSLPVIFPSFCHWFRI